MVTPPHLAPLQAAAPPAQQQKPSLPTLPLSVWAQSRSNSLPTRRGRQAAAALKPDGILMLLEACEALDTHPRLLGHRSAR